MIQVVHPGSRIRKLTFSHPGSRIPDPGVKKAPNPGNRIRIRNTAFFNIQLGDFLEFFLLLHTVFNTALSAAPQIQLCRGCWDRTQDCCDFGISSQTLLPLG
jgi:hypothetical protein